MRFLLKAGFYSVAVYFVSKIKPPQIDFYLYIQKMYRMLNKNNDDDSILFIFTDFYFDFMFIIETEPMRCVRWWQFIFVLNIRHCIMSRAYKIDVYKFKTGTMIFYLHI